MVLAADVAGLVPDVDSEVVVDADVEVDGEELTLADADRNAVSVLDTVTLPVAVDDSVAASDTEAEAVKDSEDDGVWDAVLDVDVDVVKDDDSVTVSEGVMDTVLVTVADGVCDVERVTDGVIDEDGVRDRDVLSEDDWVTVRVCVADGVVEGVSDRVRVEDAVVEAEALAGGIVGDCESKVFTLEDTSNVLQVKNRTQKREKVGRLASLVDSALIEVVEVTEG